MKPLGDPRDLQEALAEAALAKAPMPASGIIRYAPALSGAASPSYHGVESTSYLVSVDGAEPAYFLKVTEQALGGYIDLPSSAAAAGIIAGLGLAPKPLAAMPEDGAILFERLSPDWKPATIDKLATPDALEAVLAAYRTIGRGPAMPRDWTVFEGIDALRTELGDADTLPSDAWWMVAEVDEIRRAIEAAGFDRRPAHADPHATNILFDSAGAVRLVDFDMAANTDPHYQLAALLNEAFAFDSDIRAGVEIAEGRVAAEVFHRCLAYAAADDLHWALRALLMDRLSPRLGLEFRKYAGWRFLRCRMRLGRPGFEEALRRL